MPKGGRLTIETRNVVDLDEDYAKTHPEVRPGRFVVHAVSDTGRGMTPAIRSRIFEPFFTTKEKGKGTGLGLAMVFGFVKQSGGSIEVYSELGVGSTFKLYLPRTDEATALAEPSETQMPTRGTETILLVEDEEMVRCLTRRILESKGYTVLEAEHGEDALQMVRGVTRPIHLLISDVVMPELGGRQLADRLLIEHPEMKVLYLSGYTDDAVIRHGILQEKVNFLQKPFLSLALARKVREVLDSPT